MLGIMALLINIAAWLRGCRKDELWILSSSPFLSVPAVAGPCDRRALPWVAVARSRWHAPNPGGTCASG